MGENLSTERVCVVCLRLEASRYEFKQRTIQFVCRFWFGSGAAFFSHRIHFCVDCLNFIVARKQYCLMIAATRSTQTFAAQSL